MSRGEAFRARAAAAGVLQIRRIVPPGNVLPITDVAAPPDLDSPTMGVKYYTHFVLTGEAAEGSDQEFSGVVEVNQPTESRYETKDIEALLARNFDLRSGEVRLINWARLQ
jgi:hypothetical protein